MTKNLLDSILLPLDGSSLAESVIPAAQFLHEKAKSRLTLLHIVEKRPPQSVHGQHHLGTMPEAESYLAGLAGDLAIPPKSVQFRVVDANSNRVAKEIERQERECETGLTIICSHGRSGLNQLWSGSIAQRVCAISRRPILLIHPDFADFNPHSILIPLDANPDHDDALEVALDLAVALQLPIKLLLVIPTPTTIPSKMSPIQRLMPLMTSRMLDMEEDEANEYLAAKRIEVCKILEQRLPNGCLDCDFQVRRGDPARIIMESVQADPGGLPVIGTHGRAGFQGFWEGSVASKIGHALHYPLVLVPVH